MINIKYKKIYKEFIQEYERIHVNPWHEITKEELNKIAEDLINNMDINNRYKFKYFMDYIIKRLSGKEDAHTKLQIEYPLPINFKIFNNKVLINFPKELRGSRLISINGIKIEKIVEEIEEVITYGTEGKRKYEIEKALFNSMLLFGLPSLRECNTLKFKIIKFDGKEEIREFSKDDEYTKEESFDYDKYLYGENATYIIEDETLIYTHSSVQPKFKEQIEKAINELRKKDLTNINRIIIDLRGNYGGNSALNKMLMDFLLEHKEKELITLIDYRVFSGGRYALRDLLNLGTITIGEEISTPINCYGNSKWVQIDDCNFSISEHYYNPFEYISIKSKEQFKGKINKEQLIPIIYKPDICVESEEMDFINEIDTILEFAKNYNRGLNKKH